MAARKRQSYKEPTLAQLRSFREVCRLGGYAAASRELHLTSPAVWEQIHALEHFYGVKLLERDGPGVRPTARGHRLLAMIGPLLTGLASTRDVLQQEDGALPDRIALVTNLRVLVEEISGALRAFQRQFPTVGIRVRYTGIDEVEPLVLQGKADVAFTLEPGPDRPPGEETVYEPVGELDYLLITPPRHALARSRTLDLREIVGHPLVLGEPSAYSRRRVQEVLHRHDLAREARIVAETSSDEYTLDCVRAGIGVGITVGIPRGRLYRGLAVRSLREWFGTARVGHLWKRGVHVPPTSQALADALRIGLGQAERSIAGGNVEAGRPRGRT